MLGVYLDNVRTHSPLIHNITNYVTVSDAANAILAAGDSPIMADDPFDAEEITTICSGLNSRTIDAMFRAGRRAQGPGLLKVSTRTKLTQKAASSSATAGQKWAGLRAQAVCYRD